jgi:hypothetical protein
MLEETNQETPLQGELMSGTGPYQRAALRDAQARLR